jgi:polysaccharide export outer membrane protein
MGSSFDACDAGWSWARRGCILAFLATVVPVTAHAGQKPAAPAEYIVGPNDVLAISVYDHAQLTGKYRVQTDGMFTFPLIGRVQGGGLSVQAIENELRDRLSRGFLKNPQIGVTVEEFRSQQIFVIGEVRQPGRFEFTGAMTVIEALARAGSTTESAAQEVIVVRPAPGAAEPAAAPDPEAIERAKTSKDSEVIRVDLQSLQGGVLAQNVTLRAGDTLFVPRAQTVFVSGHVNRPDEYVIRTGLTVRQVLALAGGVTDRGSTGRIQIVRKVEGKVRTIDAKLEDAVQPGDTITVRERFF